MKEEDHSPEMNSIDRLKLWCQDKGAYWNPKLEYPAVFAPGYIGVKTTQPLQPGELLFSAPHQLILSKESSKHLEHIFNANPQLFSGPCGDQFKLISVMLWHKSLDSVFGEYLNNLPEDLASLLDWSQAELSELQDQYLTQEVETLRRKDLTEKLALVQCLNQTLEFANSVTIAGVQWCARIIQSKSFKEVEPSGALIPMAGFFTHSNAQSHCICDFSVKKPPPRPRESITHPNSVSLSANRLYRLNTEGVSPSEIPAALQQQAKFADLKFLEESKRYTGVQRVGTKLQGRPKVKQFTIVSGQDIPAGQEVHLSYGKYSNIYLMLNYGIALCENEDNYCVLEMPVAEVAGSKALGPPKGMLRYKLKEKQMNLHMLRDLRALKWKYGKHMWNAMFSPKDLALEVEVLELVKRFVEEKYGYCLTTIEEDENLLVQARSATMYYTVRTTIDYLSNLYEENLKESVGIPKLGENYARESESKFGKFP